MIEKMANRPNAKPVLSFTVPSNATIMKVESEMMAKVK